MANCELITANHLKYVISKLNTIKLAIKRKFLTQCPFSNQEWGLWYDKSINEVNQTWLADPTLVLCFKLWARIVSLALTECHVSQAL